MGMLHVQRPVTAALLPGRSGSPRDLFLDALRAIATVRVVVWHASGHAAVSYVIAAIPAMFFVSGSLYASSADRRSARSVVVDRIRRIALPLWFFSTTGWAVMFLLAPAAEVRISWWRWVFWLAPVWDPPGNAFEAGWLSSPLWFLRAMVWILVLAPWLRRAAARRPGLLLGSGVVLVVAIDLARRSPRVYDVLPGPLWWPLGDLTLYATFFAAGMLFGADRRLSRSGAGAVAVVAALGAAAWALTQPVPLGVVNNAHPLHLLVGTAWLALAIALRPSIERGASHRLVRPAVTLLGRRSLTIYLWHTTAILVALRLVDVVGWSDLGGTVLYAAAIVAGTAVAVAAFGWVEDVAGRRVPLLWPHAGREGAWNRRRSVQVVGSTGALGAFVLASLVAPGGSAEPTAGRTRPPVPSQQPPAPRFVTSAIALPSGPPIAAERFDAHLRRVLDTWLTTHGVDAVNVGVQLPTGERWVVARGTRPDTGRTATVDDELDITSATKLFTASFVLRAADRGLIDLDAPLPSLEAAPELASLAPITPMMLLRHRSGLVNYRETPAYEADPSSIDSAAAAVRAATAVPLTMTPGERYEYSSTNFLVLGLLLEQVTGRPVGDLFRTELIARLGLRETRHLPSEPGEPRQATAGLVMTMRDLLRAADVVLRRQDGVSEERHRLRTDLDPASGAGAGTFGYCPCHLTADGGHTFFGVGYTGGHTWIAHVPSLGITVGIEVYGSLWDDDRFEQVAHLFEQVVGDAARVDESAGYDTQTQAPLGTAR